MNNLTKNFFDQVKQSSGRTDRLFPPPAVKGLNPTLLEFIPGKSIKWFFPVKANYN